MSWYWWLLIAAGIIAVLFYLLVLPGPAEPDYRGDQLGSPAGEPAWDDLDPDTQADQLISEWQCVCAETSSRNCPVHGQEALERTAWLDDPDLIVWDAKQQAARCWEILHIEFPQLRAELGIAA